MSEAPWTRRTRATDLDLDLRWWAAANYLTIGQIYLRDNALLRDPLVLDHVKPRLLGHWGTSPGLSMIYTLLNRVIRERRRRVAVRDRARARGARTRRRRVARGHVQRGLPARRRRRRRHPHALPPVLLPGGVPSHVSVQTPGSIHEGGELGYALAHAAGAAFDHPSSSSPASSVTVRRRPVRWPRRGGCPPSSTLAGTGRCCRSSTSTGTRSPGPRCSAARATRTSRPTCAARGGTRSRSRATTRGRCSRRCWPPCGRARTRSGRSRPRRGSATARAPGAAPVAGHRPAHPEGLDRPRRGRRHPGRGHEPQPPGAAVGPGREPRAPADARGVAAVVRPGNPVRRRRPPRPRAGGAGPGGRPPDVRDALRQRRAAARGPADARTRRRTRSRSTPPASPWSRTPSPPGG